MVFHISYDLKKPGRDYASLYVKIKGLGSWCHAVDSTWYVDTQMTAEQVRDALVRVLDPSDALVVTAARAPGAWFGLANGISDWLKSHLS